MCVKILLVLVCLTLSACGGTDCRTYDEERCQEVRCLDEVSCYEVNCRPNECTRERCQTVRIEECSDFNGGVVYVGDWYWGRRYY